MAHFQLSRKLMRRAPKGQDETRDPSPFSWTVSISGTIDPGMGTVSTLSDTLFGRTRGAVLQVLYGHVEESFYLRQLARRTDITLGVAQRELRQLVDAGLVTRKIVFYSANQACPVFEEMRSLVAKTVGVHDIV